MAPRFKHATTSMPLTSSAMFPFDPCVAATATRPSRSVLKWGGQMHTIQYRGTQLGVVLADVALARV
jgi:hypothetical protein